MQSTKKKKLSEMEEEDMDLDMREEEEVDRISNLPDSLIHHILSFLTTKQVAQTSFLSKRWSYLWMTVPILDFREPTDFLGLTELQESGLVRPSSLNRNDKFMDFVDGTLHRRDHAADIQRFAINWFDDLNEYRVNSWIASAVRHNVQHLSLDLTVEKPLSITRSLFACESLISLKLEVRPDVRFPNYISFPKLKCLQLNHVDFSNEYWNENHFSNCPVLEVFNMEHCTWFGMPNFCVSAPALKYFQIDNWDDDFFPRGEDDGLQGCTLKVHAPNLETFNYNGCVAREYVLTTFPLLVRAVVQLNFKPYVATRDQRISHGAAISQLLRALANVKHLSVSDDTLQALFFADDLLKKLPTFQNTKELIMLEEVRAHTALVALLKATPNLESLVFDKPLPEEDDGVAGSEADAAEDEDDDWTLNLVNDPDCLFLHLKSVYFKEFTGNPMEMRWVILILRYAKALKTMSISNRNYSRLLNINTKSNEELMVEIPSLPRASTSCVFKFPSW